MTTQPNPTHPALDPAHTSRQYDLLFGHHLTSYDEDAVIVVAQARDNPNLPPSCTHLALGLRQEYVETVQAMGARERVDLCLAPRSMTRLRTRMEQAAVDKGRPQDAANFRGTVAECLPMAALPLDIDIDHAAHAASNLPTLDQALALLDACPLRPGLVVDSGGGLHGYLLLNGLLDPDQQTDALARVAHWLRTYGEQHGFAVDIGPMKATGSLRAAGVIRGKGGPDHFNPTPILSDGGERWTYGDITRAFAETPPVRVKGRESKGASHSDGVFEDDEEMRPGDRFALAFPISRLLANVFGCEERGSGWVYPRDDGSITSQGAHGRVMEGYEPPFAEYVVIHGTRWANDWGGEGGTGFDSFRALAQVFCDGDWRLAAHIARAVLTDEDTYEDALDVLEGHLQDAWADRAQSADLLAAAYGRTASAPLRATCEVPEPGAVTPVSDPAQDPARPFGLMDRFDAGETWTVPVGPDAEVQVGGSGHGLWKMAASETGRPIRLGQVVPWVATRAVRNVEKSDFSDATFDVRLLTADGQEVTLSGMSERDSLDPQRIVEAANTLGRGLPFPRQHDKDFVKNMLAVFGSTDRVDRRVTRRTGLVHTPDGHIFLGFHSSMTAQGPTSERLAAPPRGASRASDRPVISGIGWSRMPEDPRNAARAVQALINIAPAKPALGIALLGVFAAALTGCRERTTVTLDAVTASAKSQAAACLTPFYSVALRSTAEPPVDLENDSKAYAFAMMRVHSHLPIWLDDARVNTESARAAETSAALIASLVQAAFSGSSGGRGSGEGAIREQQSVRCPAVMTAERLSQQEAIVNRCVVVRLGPNDIDRLVKDNGAPPALDVFHTQFANTGLANGLGALVVNIVVRNLDERGPLAPPEIVVPPSDDGESEAMAAMASWASTAMKGHMARYGTERATSSAGYLRMGWDVIFAAADEHGFRDLLPAPTEVDEALLSLVADTRSSAGTADPGLRWIRAAASYVAAGRGHLVNSSFGEPPESHLHGWRANPRGRGLHGDQGGSPQGPRVGIISLDQKHVVLTVQGLRDAARLLDPQLTAYGSDEMHRLMRRHCATDLMSPGKDSKCSARLGLTSRQRGFVIAWSTWDPDDEAVPTRADAASSVSSEIGGQAANIKPAPSAPPPMHTDLLDDF